MDIEKVREFHRRVILLSDKRTLKEAYDLVERHYKHKHGTRMYKNYNSYRASISRKRKSGQIS